MKINKYRIDLSLLHKKNITEKVFNEINHNYYGKYNCEGDIYHYTSPEGLLGILKNRYFYFTDCEFLNDTSERMGINKELDHFWKAKKSQYDIDFYNLLSPVRINAYEELNYSHSENEEFTYRYFVFSTSHIRDSLSMWKYYSKNGTYSGFSIRLFNYALTDEWIDFDGDYSIVNDDVIYNHDKKQECLQEEIEYIYDIWCRFRRSNILDEKVLRYYKSFISYISLFFKNECFSDEKEFRFVAIVKKSSLASLAFKYECEETKMYDFRIVNGNFIPYIKIPFKSWNTDVCWVIDEICIGPSQNSGQIEIGIRELINSLDYTLERNSIKHSEIPLRY